MTEFSSISYYMQPERIPGMIFWNIELILHLYLLMKISAFVDELTGGCVNALYLSVLSKNLLGSSILVIFSQLFVGWLIFKIPSIYDLSFLYYFLSSIFISGSRMALFGNRDAQSCKLKQLLINFISPLDDETCSETKKMKGENHVE